MGSGHAKYIVRGAKMKCEFGSHTRKINLPLCHGAYIKGKPMMNEEDSVEEKNVPYFGICTNPGNPCNTTISLVSEEDGSPTTGKKCIPSFLGKWINTKEDALIEGKSALTTDSKLICAYGGVVGFITDGQEEGSEEGKKESSAKVLSE